MGVREQAFNEGFAHLPRGWAWIRAQQGGHSVRCHAGRGQGPQIRLEYIGLVFVRNAIPDGTSQIAPELAGIDKPPPGPADYAVTGPIARLV